MKETTQAAEYNVTSNEDLLMGVLNASLSGLQVYKSIYDEEGNIVDFEWVLVNDSVLKTWGKVREEIMGKTLLTVFPGVKNDGLLEKYIRAAKGETLVFKHHYFYDGLDIWFHLSVVPFQDGCILSSDDITVETLALERLKKSNSELEEKVKIRTAQLEKQKEDLYTVFMQAPAMVCILKGPELVFELLNPLYQRMFGTRKLIGLPIVEALPEIKDQSINGILRNVYETGKPFVGEEVVVQVARDEHSPIEDAFFNFIYSPIKDENNKTIGIYVFAYEVTAQVAAKEKLNNTLTALKDFVYTFDTDGRFVYSNKPLLDLLGLSLETIIGKNFHDLNYPFEVATTLQKYIEQVVNTGKEITDETPYTNYEGKLGYYEYIFSPVFDKHGKIILVAGSTRDITERKLAQAELKEKNDELLKINNDLDNFVYTASHDLKAPVSNIEGLLNTLKDKLQTESDAMDEETEMLLQLMDTSVNRFKSTILDLTEITKVQKLEEEDVKEINLSYLFEDVKASIFDKIVESMATIESDFSKVNTVRFSKKNLHSVAYNLLSNAIKYRDKNRASEIFIKTEELKEYIVLTVQDNGLGINKKNQKKIFAMFKRFHDHVEGSGIGLYIVKRIIDNAGGKIKVESEVGKGSTFKVYFKK